MRFKAVVFDLDGTLINSLDDLADSMNWSLSQLGLPGHDIGDYKLKIGDGVFNLAKRSLPDDKQELVPKLLELMRERYSGHATDKTRPYEGIKQVVRNLKENGCRLGVLTNKDHVFATFLVEHFFGAGEFGLVWGAAPGRAIKPDPKALCELLDNLGIQPVDAAFVGDSGVDMQVANSAGAYAVGAGWGFRPASELSEHGARVIIQKPSQLLEVLT